MTEKPTVESAEPESPPHGPEGNPPPAVGSARGAWAARVTANPPAATRPTRSRRKKILVPVVLAAIGVAVILVGLYLYRQELSGNLTLAAGILFGIGGSALVAAVQEALHD
jgi:predicted cobalt transporter CbtA